MWMSGNWIPITSPPLTLYFIRSSSAAGFLILAGMLVMNMTFVANTSGEASEAKQEFFAPTIANKVPAPGNAPKDMVWICGGEFSMGRKVPSASFCTMATMNAVNDSQPILLKEAECTEFPCLVERHCFSTPSFPTKTAPSSRRRTSHCSPLLNRFSWLLCEQLPWPFCETQRSALAHK
jgi:hypothetical protein